MAAPKTQNPLFQRMQTDLFAKPAPGPDIGQLNAMNNAGVYMPGTFGASNAAANGTGADPFSAGMAPPPSPMNLATGNVLGGPVSRAEQTVAQSASVPEQVAGMVSGLEDQRKVEAFQRRLFDAGITPANMARSQPAVQGIYDSVFGAGMPTSGPVQAFAPTGLRERTLAAGGQGVWGQGDVMAFSDGMNAQGGQKFSLGQVMPVGGPNAAPMAPANPIAASASGAPAAPKQSAYQTNSRNFKNLMVEEQQKRATAAGLAKNYIVDPADPTRVKPIPGSIEELQQKKLQQEMNLKDKEAGMAEEKAGKAIAHSTEKAKLVVDSVGKAMEKTGYFNQATGFIPFTPGSDLSGLVDTIKANIGFEELNAMRQASPTGGALGQVAVKELEFLQAALGNLKLTQSPPQLRENLNGVATHYNRWLKTTQGINPDAATFTPEKQKRLEELRAKLGKK